MLKKIKMWGWPFLTVLAVSIFPVLFLYCNNAGEVNFSETLVPLLLYSGLGLILFALALLLTRSAPHASIVASLLAAVVFNFALLEKGLKLLFPVLRYWHTLTIILVFALHIVWFLWKKLSRETACDMYRVVSLVFGGLLMVNVVTSIPSILNKTQANAKLEQSTKQFASQTANVENPNIYLLIFDEMASFKQIEKYYNYDNRELKSFLEDNKFTISYDSHNESIMTSTVMTNIVNLDYVVDNTMSEADKEVVRHNGQLFELLRQHGYQIRNLTPLGIYGEDYDVGQNGAGQGAVTASGEGFSDLLMQQTCIYPFFEKNNSERVSSFYPIIEFLSNPSCVNNEPTFSLMHIEFPHQPFVVDKNGNQLPGVVYNNWNDDSVYLGQYIYAGKLMQQTLQNLVQYDPNSLIVVMSDHGARASTDPKLFMEKFDLEDVNCILNTFYYKGMDLSEFVNLSGVNTMRMLLNQVLHTDFKELEVPVDDYKYK